MKLQATTFLNKHRKNMDQVEDKLLKAYETLLDAVADIRDVIQETNNLKLICDAIEYTSHTTTRKIRETLEDTPRRTLEELKVAGRKTAAKTALAYILLSKIAYITYLATGNTKLLSIGTLFYATGKTIENADTKKLLYLLAALTLLAENRETDALALAAYAARDKLPLSHKVPPKPWQDPRKWAALLQLSYTYEIASSTDGELLAEWGILEALREREIEE